ncbi:MAG: aminopeptidase [Bacteroidales bacterium]|nr:aminopeptidase [Bacteroidales bacterium]
MRKISLSILLSLTLLTLGAQSEADSTGFIFKTIKDIPSTSVKNQYKSGTCWSYATVSFVETEVLRLTKDSVDLSEMYFVYHGYKAKADNYVRLQGRANFGPGGQAHDVFDIIKKYGVVHESDFPGINYGTKNHEHGEFDAVLENFLKAIIKKPNETLSPIWSQAFTQLLISYLGDPLKTKQAITEPLVYAKNLKINPEDYIEMTSYTHHPFYEKMRLEIPDNWSYNADYYNVPIDVLMTIIRESLQKGYSVCWDGDVSNPGFSHQNNLAILPETDVENLKGLEMSRWENLSAGDLMKNAFSFKTPVPEKKVSQELRQIKFDNQSVTDDHLMHFTGIVQDQNGTIYYKTKNSWGNSNELGGYLYMSESYTRMNTVAIMIHKDALSKEILKKLGL